MILTGAKAKFVKLIVFSLVGTVCIYIALRIAAFAHLFGSHAGVLLTQTEVAAGHLAHTNPQIPRLIHQIYFNWTDPSNLIPPAEWASARQSCIDLNDEWENILWTAEKGRAFLDQEYSWILPMYDSLGFPVQRTDVLRYFLIRHYGGIYIDMDNGCTANLDPLRFYPMFVTDGGRGTLSNNILGAIPGHPFWIELISSLEAYNWNYPLPYVTISYATGQWFETEMWERYHHRHARDEDKLIRVLMDGREGAPRWVYFSHTHGGTWDNWDNEIFQWIGLNLVIVIGAPILSVLFVVICVVGACRRREKRRQMNTEGYVNVQQLEE